MQNKKADAGKLRLEFEEIYPGQFEEIVEIMSLEEARQTVAEFGCQPIQAKPES